MSPAVADFTDAAFETDVLNGSGTVLVDFWAAWCGLADCGAVDGLGGRDLRRSLTVGKLEVDGNPGI